MDEGAREVSILALISTLSIFSFMLVRLLDGPVFVSVIFFIAATTSILILTVCAYRKLSNFDRAKNGHNRGWISSHLVLHAVPASYLTLQLFIDYSLWINIFYIGPVMLFFFTGRQTWGLLYKWFGSKMYRIFYLGNTALLIWAPILLTLSLLDEAAFGRNFYQAMVGYFGIHFLLTGVVLVKIEKDVVRGFDS